jgi:hypothetical protein
MMKNGKGCSKEQPFFMSLFLPGIEKSLHKFPLNIVNSLVNLT